MTPTTSLPLPVRQVRRTVTPTEAQTLVTEVSLPHRLELPGGETTVDLELATARMGALAVSRVSYGRNVVVHTENAVDICVIITLRGQAEMSAGTGRTSTVGVGSAAVFPTGEPGHLTMTEDCALLWIIVPRTTLEGELEHLLGQRLTHPLELAFDLDLDTPLGKSWEPLLRLLVQELQRPTALTLHPVAARRVESVLLDALLLGHDHNYRDRLDVVAEPGGGTAVDRAVQLVDTDPTEAWSTERLAQEIHLSPRALQAGFQREMGMPPMDYVRQARLRHVHVGLVDGTPGTTSVRALAQHSGFVHLGRFAATYRDRYGESPVETLRRPLPH